MHTVKPEVNADIPLAFSGKNTDLLQKGSIAEQGHKTFLWMKTSYKLLI